MGKCIKEFPTLYLYIGLFNSLFMIMASNIGPSRTTNSTIRCTRHSRFLLELHGYHDNKQ